MVCHSVHSGVGFPACIVGHMIRGWLPSMHMTAGRGWYPGGWADSHPSNPHPTIYQIHGILWYTVNKLSCFKTFCCITQTNFSSTEFDWLYCSGNRQFLPKDSFTFQWQRQSNWLSSGNKLCHRMDSAQKLWRNGNGNMGIMATGGDIHTLCDNNSKWNVVVAFAVWISLYVVLKWLSSTLL